MICPHPGSCSLPVGNRLPAHAHFSLDNAFSCEVPEDQVTFGHTRGHRTGATPTDVYTLFAPTSNADSTYTDAGGYGTSDEPYTLQTDSAEAGSLKLHVDLRHVGVRSLNAVCAQSLVVKTYPDEEDAEAEEIEAGADAEDDICTNERYTLSVAEEGSRYTLHVFSEDGVEKVHHVALGRGPEN